MLHGKNSHVVRTELGFRNQAPVTTIASPSWCYNVPVPLSLFWTEVQLIELIFYPYSFDQLAGNYSKIVTPTRGTVRPEKPVFTDSASRNFL
jgi:hypothetical protein